MIPKGLLVIAPDGQEFLLVPEEGVEAAGYTLSVLQLHEGQWVRLEPRATRLLRETMLGALLEFFGNLCRILNQSTGHGHRVKRVPLNSYRPTKGRRPGISRVERSFLGGQSDTIPPKHSGSLHRHEKEP